MIAVGGAIRLLLWLWFAPLAPQIIDERDYVHLARHLIEHDEYAYDLNRPTSLRPPLYPALVASVFSVAGLENYQAVRLVQIILSLITVLVVYRLARDVYSSRVGLWAAGAYCFYPSFLGFGNLILTETLFTLLLTAGVCSMVRGISRTSYGSLVLAGLLFGLGALTRSILYPFAPFLGLFLIVSWSGSIIRRVLAVLAFAVPFAVVLAPWAMRNTAVHGTFVPIDCMGGRNFMMGNYEFTPLYRSWDAISISGEESWIEVLKAKHPELSRSGAVTQGQLDQIAMKEGLQFVRENPELTLKRDLVKFFDFWGLERELVAGADRGYFGPIPSSGVLFLGLVICSTYIAILFSGILGAAVTPPSNWRHHLLLLMVIGFTCVVHTVVFAHSRYHLPVMPLVMIYAAALWSKQNIKPVAGRPVFWLALLLCILIVFGWVWNGSAGDFEKLSHIFSPKS
jgi:4-amino-4-deoxy-L-arabinose transferase-like glycosyltransferase